MEKTIEITSEAAMLRLGETLGGLLEAGSFVGLYGDLGVGKSVLARGVGRALGISSLPSPTFTIVQEYPSIPPLFHFDVYRIADEEELWGIGFDDYLARNGIILMEWADLVPGCLPADRMDIRITRKGESSRSVILSSSEEKFGRIISQL